MRGRKGCLTKDDLECGVVSLLCCCKCYSYGGMGTVPFLPLFLALLLPQFAKKRIKRQGNQDKFGRTKTSPCAPGTGEIPFLRGQLYQGLLRVKALNAECYLNSFRFVSFPTHTRLLDY